MEKINVLMSCYNGEKYIEEQIKSILNQKTSRKIELYIRDDGSKDNTREVLKKYEDVENIHIIFGKNAGVMKSFFELLEVCEEADYYSFADQDDIWFEDKLERAMNQIGKKDIPVLYCSDFYNWNYDTDELTPCRHLSEPFTIVKSIVNGDSSFGFTQVINPAMRELALRYMKKAPHLEQYSHDMWCHLLAICFGELVYDKNYVAKYRRHGNNVSTQELQGGNMFSHRLWQIKQFLFGSNGKLFRKDICLFYGMYQDKMTKEQKQVFDLFLHDGNRLKKVFWKERIRRGIVDEIAIRVLFLLGKV